MMRASVIFVLGICVFPFPAAIFFGYVLPRTTPQIIRYCAIFATAALGIHGLAPQGVDAEATLYVGSAERISARLKLNYELLFTQRLILQPEVEMNLYSRADPARSLGAGVSDLEVGLRLRYEVRREFAPYVGLVWQRHWGRTASFWSAAGEDPSELTLALGLRVWL